MAIFGIITIKDKIVQSFIKETNLRLKDNNLAHNPFNGKIELVSINKREDLFIIVMQPIYWNFSYMGWICLLALLITLQHYSWLMIPCVIIGSLGIFWSKYFYYFMLKKGLKKAGYTKKVRLVSSNKIIENIYLVD